ncbi:hypothetical protein O0L34_g1246 [Tuta absoluta]|nr:hypothetical protein O0L34_g1246 [Tuta absoluta]
MRARSGLHLVVPGSWRERRARGQVRCNARPVALPAPPPTTPASAAARAAANTRTPNIRQSRIATPKVNTPYSNKILYSGRFDRSIYSAYWRFTDLEFVLMFLLRYLVKILNY